MGDTVTIDYEVDGDALRAEVRATDGAAEPRMYRWSELSGVLSAHGEIVCASAANFVTAQHDDALDSATDAERAQILEWELELCREPGALDGGTHILAVVRTPDR